MNEERDVKRLIEEVNELLESLTLTYGPDNDLSRILTGAASELAYRAPMKVIDDGDKIIPTFYCPTCRRAVTTYYCPFCGQRINWREDDKND